MQYILFRTFNRTIVELKYRRITPRHIFHGPFNRTIVELKFLKFMLYKTIFLILLIVP